MKTIHLTLKKQSYPIYLNAGLLEKTGDILDKLGLGKDAVVITNRFLLNKYGQALSASLNRNGFSSAFFTVPNSEKAKSINTCLNLIDRISRYDKHKQIVFIALGGGVVGDLTGFVASIYKRGVPYVQIPTTLLAQIDSSIGGKTAIDLKVAKNLVGAFYQPKAVIVDTKLLYSLPQRQLRSGLAEAIKYAVIGDRKLFSFLQCNEREIMALNSKALAFIEERCIRSKARVVSRDEREKRGIRTILNFGHTIGHAIESAAGYQRYGHGEAISIGMICAAEITKELKLLPEDSLRQIIQLIRLYQLPTVIRGVNVKRLLDALARDKKIIKGQNRFVLPVAIGRVVVKTNVPPKLIRRVITARIEK